MFEQCVAPDLPQWLSLRPARCRTILTVGVSESKLQERLNRVQREGLHMGFRALPTGNEVKLRFMYGCTAEVEQACVQDVLGELGDRAVGVDCGDLAQVLGARLVAREETLALAESCTAGGLAAWIGGVPGASRYLLEGAVVYADQAKLRTCGVSAADLEEHGAVSEPVARQLAIGIRERAGSTWGVGITGIAGPGGGTAQKPVGTVHISVAGPGLSRHRVCHFRGERALVNTRAMAAALALLVRQLSGASGS